MMSIHMKEQNMTDTIVVKIGGSTLGDHDTTIRDLVALQKEGLKIVVVHGGGAIISEWMEVYGISPRFENGLRVTDAKDLQVATAVLAGLVNKQLVSSLLSIGGNAIGLSGIDGGIIECKVLDKSLGYVGEIMRVNTQLIKLLFASDYMPIIAPLGLNREKDHATSLNINGDTVAGELAFALKASKLIFLTDVEGVRDKANSVIPRLNMEEMESLVSSDVITSGMIPKVRACQKALTEIGSAHITDGRHPHALKDIILGKLPGTLIEGAK